VEEMNEKKETQVKKEPIFIMDYLLHAQKICPNCKNELKEVKIENE
jgi:hypothetical protein